MRIIGSVLLSVQLLSFASPAFAASNEDDAMAYALSQGILEVQSDGDVHAEAPLSRKDLVNGVVRLAYAKDIHEGCFSFIAPTPRTSYSLLFSDVRKDAPFGMELCVGMLTGIVEGRQDGSFAPFESATLAEAAKVITKAYGLAPGSALQTDTTVSWDEPYWYQLARRNVLPRDIRNRRSAVLTRGQFAEILYGLRGERPIYGARYESSFAVNDPTVAEAPAVTQTDAPVLMSDAGRTILQHVAIRREGRLSLLPSGAGGQV